MPSPARRLGFGGAVHDFCLLKSELPSADFVDMIRGHHAKSPESDQDPTSLPACLTPLRESKIALYEKVNSFVLLLLLSRGFSPTESCQCGSAVILPYVVIRTRQIWRKVRLTAAQWTVKAGEVIG